MDDIDKRGRYDDTVTVYHAGQVAATSEHDQNCVWNCDDVLCANRVGFLFYEQSTTAPNSKMLPIIN